MQHGALPKNCTITLTPPTVTTGSVERSSPVPKMARKVGPLPVLTLNAPSANVIALRMAPSCVPDPVKEKIPGGADLSIVTLEENVPVEEVTTSVWAPNGVAAFITALI